MARLQIDIQGNITQFSAEIAKASGMLANLQKQANINLGGLLGGGSGTSSQGAKIGRTLPSLFIEDGKESKKALEDINKEVLDMNSGMAMLGTTSNSTFGGINKHLLKYVGLTAGLGAVYKVASQATQSIIDFDSGMIDISKTTGIAGVELSNLSKDMVELSRQLQVVDTSKLLEYATVAGQLGIHGSKDIQNFSSALAQLETATDVSGRAGAEQVARFLQLADGGVKNIKTFGDELVHLGNNFAATERQILSNALSIAQNTGAYNIARHEMLAYAAATSAVGIQSEVVGSAMNRVLQQLSIAVAGGKNATEVFNVMGVSQEKLADMLRNDASGAFKLLVENLNDSYKAGADLNSILRDMGVRNIRDIRVVQTLATKGFGLLEESMSKVVDSTGAMGDEFDTQSKKISKQIDRVRISWENLVLTMENGSGIIGRAVVGAFEGIATSIERLNDAISSSHIVEFFAKIGNMASTNPAIQLMGDIMGRTQKSTSGEPTGKRGFVSYKQFKPFLDADVIEQQRMLIAQQETYNLKLKEYERDNSIRKRDDLNYQAEMLAKMKARLALPEPKETVDIDNGKEDVRLAEERAKKLRNAREEIDKQLASWGLVDANLRIIDRKYDDLIKKAKLLNLEAGEMSAILNSKDMERFVAIFGGGQQKVTRGGLPQSVSGPINIPNQLPGLEQATERILKNLSPKITFGDELSRQTQRAITRGLVRGFEDVFNNIGDLGSNFYEVFSNVFKKLGDTTMSTFQNALLNSFGEKFSEKFSKGFRFGNLSTDVSNAIVAGVGMGASLLGSNVFKPTSTGGQALSGALGMGVTGLAIGGPIGGLIGAGLGAITGIFGAKRAKKQEKIQEAQLKEQEKMRKELERQSALAWDARIIGQMSNLGLVTGIDRDLFGNIVGRIEGKDIVLVYDRASSSR